MDIILSLKTFFLKLDFVVPVSFIDHQGLHIVDYATYVLKDLIIIVLGLEYALEKKIIGIYAS